MSSAKPGVLATAANLTLFVTICVLAHCLHLKAALSPNQKKKKREKDDTRPKLVVITGCDRGIGRLLAENLQKSDEHDYLVLALTLTQQAADELNGLDKDRMFAIQCDVTSDEDVQKTKDFVEHILKSEKAVLYSIVNNAGIADPGDFAWFSDLNSFRRIMEVNFFGQLRVTQALLPLMIRTAKTLVQGARILNMSSVCGATASPSNSSYNASKFAVEAWSDSIRLELQSFNINVVKVRPGQFSTEIQKDWAENLIKNYSAAPNQIHEWYGGDAFRDKVVGLFQSAAASSTPLPEPTLVVDALTDMLKMKQSKLEPYYWIGQDAHTLWRALHSLPTSVSDLMKLSLFHFRPVEQELPPVDVISHVTIRVRNIEASLPFYEAFGLEKMGKTENGQQFLRSGSVKNRWSALVLLQEDKSMKARGKSSDAGMTRLCIYTSNIYAEVKRLSAKGIQAMAPTAETGEAKIAAYYDPDKFVVYLLQFNNILGAAGRVYLWWNKRVVPCLFHWTVNVTNAQVGLSAFEALGFNTLSDQNSEQVVVGLLPAFNIDPKSSEIKHIRMCKLPDDAFVATIMEWVHPKSDPKGAELMNSMTLSVTDVEAWLERARNAGMTTEPAKYQRLPVFGEVFVGSAFVEPGCNRIEFCCFTNKQ